MWMKHLIHRDLKPQNILLSSDAPDATLKIGGIVCCGCGFCCLFVCSLCVWGCLISSADFGFARHLEAASLADTLCGSPLYMAPEILRYQRYDAKVIVRVFVVIPCRILTRSPLQQADLWSVGAILFEMLTKRPPFTGANHLELLANIERRDAVLPPDIVVSKECKQFLDCLLRRNPHMRMSFQVCVVGVVPWTVFSVGLPECVCAPVRRNSFRRPSCRHRMTLKPVRPTAQSRQSCWPKQTAEVLGSRLLAHWQLSAHTCSHHRTLRRLCLHPFRGLKSHHHCRPFLHCRPPLAARTVVVSSRLEGPGNDKSG
jgi:serine/threonine protein kinase